MILRMLYHVWKYMIVTGIVPLNYMLGRWSLVILRCHYLHKFSLKWTSLISTRLRYKSCPPQLLTIEPKYMCLIFFNTQFDVQSDAPFPQMDSTHPIGTFLYKYWNGNIRAYTLKINPYRNLAGQHHIHIIVLSSGTNKAGIAVQGPARMSRSAVGDPNRAQGDGNGSL